MNTERQSVINGLNSDSCKILTAGIYSITTRSDLNEPSGIVVTITQSGSASSTFTSLPTSAQSAHQEVTGQFNCAAGDTITVAVTSSASADQPPSLVKTTICLRPGV